jgi:hypothetical protein
VQNASLLKQIEQCRAEMITLSYSYPMTDDVVVQSSKRLDDLLNQYQNKTRPVTCSLN